jgi:predicted O-methyltransferase YrrM
MERLKKASYLEEELPEMDNYLLELLPTQNKIIKEMEEYAINENFPIVGEIVGNLLMNYARMIKAERVLELGSGFGYSALWFAMGMDNGKIICTDFSEEYKEKATNAFEQMGQLEKLDFRVGDGLELLTQLEGEFDIIFSDVEKEDYPLVFKKAIPKLKKGGILITDNTLWYGKIFDEKDQSKSTKGVKEYNRLAFSTENVLSVLIPIRDGITISLKI